MAKKRKNDEFLSFMKITFAIVFLLGVIGVSIKPSTFIWVFAVVCSISLVFIFLSTPFMKGKIGEWFIAIFLKNLSKKYNCKVINDVVIISDGKSSQIDHIVIHNSGIYVIETKNYSGRIYGKAYDKQWMQVLAYGKVKNKLYSPIFQNAVHIYRLKEILGLQDNLYSLVVFLKGNIRYIDAAEVFTPKSMYNHIVENIEIKTFSDEETNELYNKINEFKTNPLKTTKEHVEQIKETKRVINENICPHCNTPLILRTSRNGKQFYGCNNYPNCKFTKNV